MVYYDGEHGTTTLQLPPLVGKDATSVGALPETEPVLFLGGEEHGGRPAQFSKLRKQLGSRLHVRADVWDTAELDRVAANYSFFVNVHKSAHAQAPLEYFRLSGDIYFSLCRILNVMKCFLTVNFINLFCSLDRQQSRALTSLIVMLSFT